MKEIKINNEISIDLTKLMSSKLLIQANSGGGKSWLIRRLVEQAYGKVQIIIIDPEGEFSTLREKYDFVLAGKGGDTPAEPRSATLLARKLLELEVSTIIDLYELHPQERKHFVKLFLESMINAPKELHHDVLIVIDEAHMFAPEKGDSEAMGAVIDLASRGRKRGFCAVLATQRISKLAKDVAAECNNKLIGRTSLDIDRKRASDELGITSKEEIMALRTLSPGEFFAFGPAISNEVIKIKVGNVRTSVPKAGSLVKVSPPTNRVKKILSKLADLPQEAKQEAQTVAELKQQVKILTDELKNVKVPKQPQVIDPKIIQNAVSSAIKSRDEAWTIIVQDWKKYYYDTYNAIKKAWQENENKPADKPNIINVYKNHYKHIQVEAKTESVSPMKVEINETSKDTKITGGAKRMFETLVSIYPQEISKEELGNATGMSHDSGTFGTYVSILRSNNLVEVKGQIIKLSENIFI